MKEYIKALKERYERKREEYERALNLFKVEVERELHDTRFEQNAISKLTVLLETKTRLQELEKQIEDLERINNGI